MVVRVGTTWHNHSQMTWKTIHLKTSQLVPSTKAIMQPKTYLVRCFWHVYHRSVGARWTWTWRHALGFHMIPILSAKPTNGYANGIVQTGILGVHIMRVYCHAKLAIVLIWCRRVCIHELSWWHGRGPNGSHNEFHNSEYSEQRGTDGCLDGEGTDQDGMESKDDASPEVDAYWEPLDEAGR